MLARPLSAGLQMAAAIADFDELAERNLWNVDADSASWISHEAVDGLYDAKCRDQNYAPIAERRVRFHALMAEACRGQWFVLRQAGLGLHSTMAICSMLWDNAHITHLDLSGNSIGAEGAKYLSQLLQVNDTLVVLRLQSANLGDGTTTIANALKANNTLTALDLSGIGGIHRNTIWGASAAALAEMVEWNQVLAYINVASCGLQKATTSIVMAAVNSGSLTALNVSSNHSTDDVGRAVEALLSEGRAALARLELSHNSITAKGMDRIASGLLSRNITAQALRHLDLSHNNINGSQMETLGAALRDSSLEELILASNPLTEVGFDPDGFRLPNSCAGLQHLFAGLGTDASSLKVLDLSFCGIAELPENVPSALGHTTSLERLDLHENGFGDGGAALLGAGLQRNTTLTTFNMAQCKVTTQGMTAVAAGIRTHVKLERLKCQQGSRLDFYASGLVEAVNASGSLLQADFPKDPQRAVAAKLEHNKAQVLKMAEPQLAEARRTAYIQQRSLDQAKDMITSEVKSRDKLTEQSKLRRDRQKAQMAIFKAELQELLEAKERQQHVVDTMEVELNATEESMREERRVKGLAVSTLRTKLEREQAAKADAITAIIRAVAEHRRRCPDTTVQVPKRYSKKGGSASTVGSAVAAVRAATSPVSQREDSTVSFASSSQQSFSDSTLSSSPGARRGSIVDEEEQEIRRELSDVNRDISDCKTSCDALARKIAAMEEAIAAGGRKNLVKATDVAVRVATAVGKAAVKAKKRRASVKSASVRKK